METVPSNPAANLKRNIWSMLMPHTISLVSRTPLSWSSSQVIDLPFLDSRLESALR